MNPHIVSPRHDSPSHGDLWGVRIVSLALWLGIAWVVQPIAWPTEWQRLQRRLVVAIGERDAGTLDLMHWLEAIALDDAYSLALLSEAASLRGEWALAQEFADKLPNDGGKWEFFRELRRGRRAEIDGRLREAELHLERALALSPYNPEVNDRLGHLLQVEGRVWEATGPMFVLIRIGKCRGDELLGMASSERFFRRDERIERVALERQPPEAMMQLGVARRIVYENQGPEVEALLRGVVAEHPELGEAQGRLGRLIVDRGRSKEFLQWRGRVPDEAREHPEVWFVQGLAARQMKQTEGAVRCFLEALRLSPNHLAANIQIAGALQQLGLTEAARGFRERGEILSELESLLNIMRGTVDPPLMLRALRRMGKLGRYWEAAGWAHVLTRLARQEIPIEELTAEKRHWLKLARRVGLPQDPDVLPARSLDLARFATPRWPARDGSASESLQSPGHPASVAIGQPPWGKSDLPPERRREWAFQDVAAEIGIDFRYFEGTREENRLEHIFNTMGGGLAAVDYDQDGWPDLYIAQGNNWRDASPQPQWIDRLYRNRLGDRFEDVTELAGLREASFSHGVTVGDYDADGFADISVGNLGPNRLYRNNGDGTFADVTHSAGVGGDEWSTSSVLADFNGDGLQDLYVLNYSLREATAAKECGSPADRRACTPDLLTAEYDRLYINSGDGQFRDASEPAGIFVPDGKGLGVVAWDFAGNGRLGLFIANDTTPNFLFLNEGTSADEGTNGAGVPRFVEEGVVRGVAFDQDGNAQASMGVAASDADGDGRIELFITNFFADASTLYSQQADGFFRDLTRPYELRDPSFWMLGFGCQFADFDVDGRDDLIATNGHVDRQSSRGDPDRMPPQLFHNLTGKEFAEVPAVRLGQFFQGTYLGRGLASWDWNRDGRPDVAISHLHDPVAVLQNDTRPVHRPLTVRLTGVRGDRQPTGAVVSLTTGANRQFRLQTAGDGFLVTNERRLQLAVPQGVDFVDLEVRWLDGSRQIVEHVPTSAEVRIIEGRRKAVVLKRY